MQHELFALWDPFDVFHLGLFAMMGRFPAVDATSKVGLDLKIYCSEICFAIACFGRLNV